MAQIIATCEKCSTQYRLDAEKVGKKVKCRRCRSPFLVTPAAAVNDEPDDDEFGDEADFQSPPISQQKPARGLGQIKRRSVSRAAGPSSEAGATRKSSNRLIVASICIAAIVMLGGMVFIGSKLVERTSAASGVQVPEEFELYQHPECAIWFEFPSGWEVSHGGGRGGIPAWAKIEGGRVTISIRDNFTSAVMGDLFSVGASLAGDQLPPELEPVHKVHEFRLGLLQAENPEYQETDPEVFETRLGKARLSEFVKPEGFTTSYGYRATLPPGMRQFTVTCECSKKDFEALKPAFRRIIASCSIGSP